MKVGGISLGYNSFTNDAAVNDLLLDLHVWVGLWVDHVWLWGVHLAGAAPHLAPWEAVGEHEAEEGEEGEGGPDAEPLDAVQGDDQVEGSEAELQDHLHGVGGPPGAWAAEGEVLDAFQPEDEGVDGGGSVHEAGDDLAVGDGLGAGGGGDVCFDPVGKGAVRVFGVLDHSGEIVLSTVEAVWPDEHPDNHGGVVAHAKDGE